MLFISVTRKGYTLETKELDRMVKLKLVGARIWFVSLDVEAFTQSDSFYLSYFDTEAGEFMFKPGHEGRMMDMLAELDKL